jgi:hypothetical protein
MRSGRSEWSGSEMTGRGAFDYPDLVLSSHLTRIRAVVGGVVLRGLFARRLRNL